MERSEGMSCWLWELGGSGGKFSIGVGVGVGASASVGTTSNGCDKSKLGAGAGLVLGRYNNIAYLSQCCH